MSIQTPRIAFLKHGRFSHINQHVEWILREGFPNHEVDVIDVELLLQRNWPLLVGNMPRFVYEYGLSANVSLAQHRKNFFRTSYLFRRAKQIVNQMLDANEYLFSLQTQSFFDLSTPGIPHFVYTDHAILSNLAYPDVTYAEIEASYPAGLIELERTIYQNAAKVFTMGSFVSKTLCDAYGCTPEKVVTVGGGSNIVTPSRGDVATSAESDNDTTAATLSRYQAKNILFVGVAWERKGGPTLVEAFSRLRYRHPTASLSIVGCAPEIELDGCDLVGPVPLADVASYYKRASLFCMPSLREPFGLAFIEASMSRLPVVATNVGAIPDIVLHGKSGLLVEPDDVDGLVAALDSLLSAPTTCAAYGDYGHDYVGTRYTWDVVGDAICRHIESSLR